MILHPTYPISSGHRFVDHDVVVEYVSRGCVMCEQPFLEPEYDIEYETTDLYCIGLTPKKSAECKLAVLRSRFFNPIIVIIDQKAAVCILCWIKFLHQSILYHSKD